MKIRLSDEDKKKLIIAVICAVLSGTLNGLFGSGGGILLTYMFVRLCRSTGDAFASVVMSVAIMSLTGLWRYYSAGNIDLALLEKLIVPAAAGGFFGAWISGKIKGEGLRLIFAVMLVISGVNMAL